MFFSLNQFSLQLIDKGNNVIAQLDVTSVDLFRIFSFAKINHTVMGHTKDHPFWRFPEIM